MQAAGNRDLLVPSATNRGLKLLCRAALLIISSALFTRPASAQNPPAPAKCPPATRVDTAKDIYGSTVVANPYRWLEDQNSPETRAWIDAEQKCTESVLSTLPGRAQLSKRLTELLHTDSFEPPIERGGRYFFRKRLADQELPQIFMRHGVNTPDELLVDPLPWSADHSASAILENVSRDGRYLIFGRREGGQDETTPRVLEADTKKVLPDAFPRGQYFSIEPAPGNKALYYVRVTSDGPRAFYHLMGSDPAKDQIIFGKELGNDKILVLQLSEDGKYLVYLTIYGSGSEQTDIHVQNVSENGPPVAAVAGDKALFYPTFAGDQLFILTN